MLTGLAVVYQLASLYQVARTRGSPPRWLDLVVVLLCAGTAARMHDEETLLIVALMLWLACSWRRYWLRRRPPLPVCAVVRR